MATDRPTVEYLLTGAGGVEAALAALRTRYTVAVADQGTATRIWLDTFDSRLRAAGLTLACLPPDRATTRGQLMLAGGPAAAVPLRQQAPGRWPSLIAALPAGAVRDRLRPVAGLRALLPVATVRVDSAAWTVRNREQKIVLRAVLEQATIAGSDVTLPPRLRLAPLRGYDGPADRAAALIGALDAVTTPATPEPELVLAAGLGALPRPRPAPVVRADQSATTSVAALLLDLLDTAAENVPGVIDDVDTEFLHDLRVAVRRTRSALKLAGDALPDGLAKRFAPHFKWLGDLTTPMRDLDVLLLDFDPTGRLLASADPADLEPLRAHLRRQRGTERRRLLAGLRSPRFEQLTADWHAALAPLAADDPGHRSGPDTAHLARRRIDRAWRQVTRRAAATTVDSPAAQLHDLRKRCKELRYVLELFAAVCQPGPYRALLRDLKGLQDHLGEFQDAEVHQERIRGYAAAMLTAGTAPAATLLAMGELVARFGERQRAAAAESVTRVGAFVDRPNQRRVADLVVPA